MAALRRRQGLSLRGLAGLAGISHDALGAWERGARLPRLPELEAALTALEVSPAERRRLIALVPAPRARREVSRGSEEPPLGAGPLLRAMRSRRGLTQADAARLVGVSQGRLASWERSEDWPVADRLHRLCFALGAHPQEAAALTQGRGALPLWNEDESAEAWEGGGEASPEDPMGRLIKRVYFHTGALRDLCSLSLEQSLRRRAQDTAAFQFHLHDLYAYRARAMMEEGRFGEVGGYADRTWELARQGYGRSQAWTWGVIASATVLKRGLAGRRPHPEKASALLAAMAAQAEPGESRAWMLCELSLALAQAGRAEESLQASLQACRLAATLPQPEELWFRRRDHAALLVSLGHCGEALETLETTTELFQYGADPMIRHRLLAAACHMGLKHPDAAQEALAPVLPLIEQSAAQGNVQIAALRPQAEALLARL